MRTIARIIIIIVFAIAILGGVVWYVYFRVPPSTSKLTVNQRGVELVDSSLLVAFIGDQGQGEGARAVLELIKDEGAAVVVHQGDFDYADNPDQWDGLITEVLGADFPYFATVGNHDLDQWPAYQQKLVDRLGRISAASCSGDLGVNASCQYGPVFFALSGVGTLGADHISYLNSALATADATWKICSWHKNQHLMQTGLKLDEVGWEAYETCRQHGAVIVTAHEHSYARTHLLSDFAEQTVSDTDGEYALNQGQTIAVVSGLGGHSIRVGLQELVNKPWWGATYNANDNATFGAFFCAFGDSTTNHATCYFKDINGYVPDRFELVSGL